MNKSIVLRVSNLVKEYQSGSRRLRVLDDISFDIEQGTTGAIVGPSGSGKTTLLALCAGLDQATSGQVEVNGISVAGLSEDERSVLRNEQIGFVFQNFQLMPTLTALENVMVPLELRGERKVRDKAASMLEKVGLGDRLSHYPVQLSGGEQQRVALARAFINDPQILFADEPTGNLDEDTGEKVTELLFDLNADSGTTLLLVTHDLDLAARTGRIIRLKGGRIVSDELTGVADERLV